VRVRRVGVRRVRVACSAVARVATAADVYAALGGDAAMIAHAPRAPVAVAAVRQSTSWMIDRGMCVALLSSGVVAKRRNEAHKEHHTYSVQR